MSSPTFPITVICSCGTTRIRPSRNLAAPIPPAKATIKKGRLALCERCILETIYCRGFDFLAHISGWALSHANHRHAECSIYLTFLTRSKVTSCLLLFLSFGCTLSGAHLSRSNTL